MMRVGIDFDNTLVRYDRLFHRAAVDAELIFASVPANKNAVRNCLREMGREEDWILLQGLVYGARMAEAEAFPGAVQFLCDARYAGIEVFIVSHKTRTPFRGPSYDLHAAAREWIDTQLVQDGQALLPPENVFFELTKEDKWNRIASCGCDVFIDDLPEILMSSKFPEGVERLLFDPDAYFTDHNVVRRVTTWSAIAAYLLPPLRKQASV